MDDVDEPIELFPYNQRWPALFASESQRIASELPGNVAIEHFGSTSIPGMLAKPVIDLMVGMEARLDPASVRAALVTLGYEDLGEAGVPGRIYFRRRGATAFNIALVTRGGPPLGG